MLIVSSSYRSEKVLRWSAFRRDTGLLEFFGLANRHCPILLLPASPVFCLLSIPSTCQPSLHSAVVKSVEETCRVFLCVPPPAWLHCIQPSLQWEQEIPEVIHAAYCFLSCSERRFHRLAPTPPFLLVLDLQTSFFLHPSCFKISLYFLLNHKIPFIICVIRLILRYVSQFFQMVIRTHDRPMQMGLLSETMALNPR